MVMLIFWQRRVRMFLVRSANNKCAHSELLTSKHHATSQ